MASGKQLGTRFGNTIAVLKADSVFLGAEEVISRNCHTGVQNGRYIPAEGGRFPSNTPMPWEALAGGGPQP